MANDEYIPRPSTVEVTRSSLNSLKGDVARERRQVKGLAQRLAEERDVCKKALEEAVTARSERDEVRRVLAASIRGEKFATDRCAKLELRVSELEVTLTEYVAEAGRQNGRNAELSERLHSIAQQRTEELLQIKAELTKERERFESETSAAVLERGRLEGQVQEFRDRLGTESPSAVNALRIRAMGFFAAAAVTWTATLALLPPLFRSLFGSTRPESMLLATGLSGWGILGSVLSLLCVGLGLYTLGMRDLRASTAPRA